MQRISLEIYTSVYDAVKIIRDVADQRVEMNIPVGSVLLDNILSLRIIEEAAKRQGKQVSFSTNDPLGKNLIRILNGETEEVTIRAKEQVLSPVTRTAISRPKFKMPALPVIPGRLSIIIPVLLILFSGLSILFLLRQHKADITLYFSPQLQTKSVKVKVADGRRTDPEASILSGLKITKSVDASLTANATGTKIEGEKAAGEVTLYNSTIEDITLKKGTLLTYKGKNESLIFVTNTSVTVPKRTDVSPDTITKGSVVVAVIAEAVGESYNIKKDKDLAVKGYKSSELTAVTSKDFKGGLSKEVKIVTQSDITRLQESLSQAVTSKVSDTIKNSAAAGFIYVEKSEKIVSNNTVINNKVGDEKDTLSGSITAQVEALTYSKAEMSDLMNKLSQSLVPSGYEFHSYNNDLTVGVLGKSDSSVLSPTEADLQVTLRFNTSPKIDQQKIFSDIKGKSMNEAEKILSAINNVEKVEINVRPNLPFFRNIPLRQSNVIIQKSIKE